VGGIARTESYKGYRFDIGGHRFLTKVPEVQALWDEWLGEDFLRVSRLSRIYYNGGFFDYPLDLANVIRNLGPLESARIAWSYAHARLAPITPEASFEDWVTNRFGSRLFRTFFKTYTEKVWGVPCHVLRADWAAQRIRDLSLTRAVAHAVFGGATTTVSLAGSFRYPVQARCGSARRSWFARPAATWCSTRASRQSITNTGRSPRSRFVERDSRSESRCDPSSTACRCPRW
jgi:protoporphyrinogen oxidase